MTEQSRESGADEIIVAGVTRLEEADTIRLWRASPQLRKMRTRLGCASAWVALMGFSAAFSAFRGEGLVNAVGAVLLLLFSAVLVWVPSRWPRSAWRRMPEWERQIRYELTNSHFRTRTENTSFDLDWSVCRSWHETLDSFFLEANGPRWHIIPKRAFEEHEIALVRDVLQRHVPHVRRRRPPTWIAWAVRIAVACTVLLLLAFMIIYQMMIR